MRAKCSEAEFIELYELYGPEEMGRRLDLEASQIGNRRRHLERKLKRKIVGPNPTRCRLPMPQGKHRLTLDVLDGEVLVGSDFHYWPGETTLMHKAFVAFVRERKPKAVILNGDVMDAPSISRHMPIGWEHRPQLIDEIEWCQDRTHEIAQAGGKCRKIWVLGNHDQRYETRLAHVAPEYAKVHGFHLKDSFPLWETAWSVAINAGTPEEVFVKHRFRGGIHAVHNNLLWSGVHIVTGHLHSAQVRPLTLHNERTLWGVDSGCIAEPSARAFVDYTEDSPKNWRSAFCLLTFKAGRLMMPELILKWTSDSVQFRGEIIKL
jgi:predicted phosphodiesterase